MFWVYISEGVYQFLGENNKIGIFGGFYFKICGILLLLEENKAFF